MTKENGEGDMIKDAVIDKVQQIVDQSRKELQKINCESHGQALIKLDFDRATGSFKIESCCESGEKLLNTAIEEL